MTVIEADARTVSFDPSRLWWVWLVLGIGWIVGALAILQFERASVTTVGVIIGIMFMISGIQQIALAAVSGSLRLPRFLFGCLFLLAGVVCLLHPEDTFHGFADILGFLFLVVGLWWTIQAFLTREADSLWWLGLIGGLVLIVIAFETSGQLFIEKAYALLVFAGLWALMQGVLDIVHAFQVRAGSRAL